MRDEAGVDQWLSEWERARYRLRRFARFARKLSRSQVPLCQPPPWLLRYRRLTLIPFFLISIAMALGTSPVSAHPAQTEVLVFPPCVRAHAVALGGEPEGGVMVYINPYARLGNNFYQLCRAYFVARVLHFHVMHVVRDFVFINRTITLPGPVRVYARGLASCEPPRCRNSEWWIGFRGCMDELDVYYFFLQMRDSFVAQFFPEPVGMTDDTLVVHLRGGDEARLRPIHNQYYGQPPCQYFLDVIRQFPESFLLTDGASESDGRWNPCHDRIVKAGAKTTNADLRHDFEMMIWSRNFVLSVSTLSFAAVWLSPVKKRFWTFNNYFQIKDIGPEHPQGNFQHVGEHRNCVASPEYVEAVLQSWGATDAQFERLVNDQCKWVTVPGVPREAWPLANVHGIL